jgi:hypothetical protein
VVVVGWRWLRTSPQQKPRLSRDDRRLAIEERNVLVRPAYVRTLRGWQCAAGLLGQRGEKYGQDSGGGSVVLLSMIGGSSIF